MNRFHSLEKIILGILRNTHVQSLGKMQDFPLLNWTVTSPTHCHLLKFKLYDTIPYGINFFRIVLWNCRPSFWNWYLYSKKLEEFFLLWAPPGIPSVTDACQGGSGLIFRSAATLSVCLESLSRKTLGLTPDTGYSRGEKHSEIECHKC